MTGRLFTEDRLLDRVSYWHYDEGTDTAVIESRQEIDGLIDLNKQFYNDAPKRWGELTLVASIPMNLYMKLKTEGVINDQAAFKRWLNDPDNRFFRTRPGAV